MISKSGRVLLIEDNSGDARLLAETLRDVPGQPFDVIHAALLSHALEKLRLEHFEAILLDLSLPDGKGLDTLRHLLEAAPSLPVLVLTGLNDETMALAALSAGAQDYLVKGAHDGDSITRAIRYAIQRKEFFERTRALREIDQAITSTLDIQEILTALLEKTGGLFPFSAACVRKRDREANNFETIAQQRIDAAEIAAFEWDCLDAASHLDGPAVLRPRRGTAGPAAAETRGWDSALAFPLHLKERIWGYLCFFLRNDREFKAEELDFICALASQVAVAIQNADLFADTVALAEDLRRSNKVKDDFLSIMSHELRTPLNIVMNCAEIIRTGIVGEITDEQADILDRLMSQAKNQLTLVNGILHATRMETEQLTACLEDVAVATLLGNLQSDYALSFAKEGVELHWDFAPDLPVAKLDGDKLRHVLENLINNAIKFTEKGSIRVSASVCDFPGRRAAPNERQPWLVFEIADTGIGMPEESLALIFEKFCQLDTTSTRLHGGVGIGLYLVKRFVTALSGEITVNSQVRKGSTFTIRIPLILARGSTTQQHGFSASCTDSPVPAPISAAGAAPMNSDTMDRGDPSIRP